MHIARLYFPQCSINDIGCVDVKYLPEFLLKRLQVSEDLIVIQHRIRYRGWQSELFFILHLMSVLN